MFNTALVIGDQETAAAGRDLVYTVYLGVDDTGEVAWFLEVVESFHFHKLSDDFIGDLVAPVIDHWHVNVIDEHGHLLASRWTKRATHSLLDVTLEGSLHVVTDKIII